MSERSDDVVRGDVRCDRCGADFGRRHGYLDLRPSALATEQYRDPAAVDGFAARESAGSDRRFREYFAPLLRGMGVDRVACLGCGGGDDGAALVASGLDAVGADLPHRAAGWAAAGRDAGCFVVADGRRLPWADETFDAAGATGVLEHIGAVEDGVDLHDDYEAQRIAFLAESTRICDPAACWSWPHRTARSRSTSSTTCPGGRSPSASRPGPASPSTRRVTRSCPARTRCAGGPTRWGPG